MGDPAKRLATYRDLLALDVDVRAEILGGEIVTAPAPLPIAGDTSEGSAKLALILAVTQ